MSMKSHYIVIGVLSAGATCVHPVSGDQKGETTPARMKTAVAVSTTQPFETIQPLASNIVSFDFDAAGNIGLIRYGSTKEDEGTSFVLLSQQAEVVSKIPFKQQHSVFLRLGWSHGNMWHAWRDESYSASKLTVLEFDAAAGSVVERVVSTDGIINAYAPDHQGGYVIYYHMSDWSSRVLEGWDAAGQRRFRSSDRNTETSRFPSLSTADVLADGRIVLCAQGSMNLYVFSRGGDWMGSIRSGELWSCTRSSYEIDAGFGNEIVIIPPVWDQVLHMAVIDPNPEKWKTGHEDQGRFSERWTRGTPFSRKPWTNIPMNLKVEKRCYPGGVRIAPDGRLWVASTRGLERLDQHGHADRRILGAKPAGQP